MKLALAVALAVTGCKGILGIDDPALAADAATDSVGSGSDAEEALCLGAFQPICLDAPPVATRAYTENTTIEPATELACEFHDVGPLHVCVIAAMDIFVDRGVVVDTTGDSFVVFVATRSITIDGTLARWNSGPPEDCQTDRGGSQSGGAGGGFGTRGGDGGRGGLSNDTTGGATIVPTTFRDGCEGGSGGNGTAAGGQPGGAILLIAPRIQLGPSAILDAAGDGGAAGLANARGGGGGGSGGMILLDATDLVAADGATVIAVGGGGGGGGGGANMPGESGGRADPTSASISAPGGEASGQGDGGDGGTDGPGADGRNGTLGGNGGGGGGGGGGAGVIEIMGNAMPGARFIPMPS